MEFHVPSTLLSAGTGAALGAFANALMQGRARWIDTQMLAAALAREVLMCGRKLAVWRHEIQTEHQVGLGRTRVPPCPLAVGDFVVYQGNASNLGKLPPWLIIRTMHTYERFRSFSAVHGSERLMERPECEDLLRRIHRTFKAIDAQVFTELEVLAATPYWKMWQLRFDAWRSKTLMRDTGCA